MIAKIDRETCTGCGLCEQTCPQVFEMDAEGKAVVKTETVPSEYEESSCAAAVECPVAAISVE
ncbi:MAG: ferredoxin [Chitinispirillaceae bacterium]|nr:ferredoxin [Chitinispirillaceae bacterium]